MIIKRIIKRNVVVISDETTVFRTLRLLSKLGRKRSNVHDRPIKNSNNFDPERNCLVTMLLIQNSLISIPLQSLVRELIRYK